MDNPQAVRPPDSNQAVGEATFDFLGFPVRIVVLANGQRVIPAQDLDTLMKLVFEADPTNQYVAGALRSLGEFVEHVATPAGLD